MCSAILYTLAISRGKEKKKKKTRLEDVIFTFLIKNTFISTINIYTEMGEKLYSGDVQLADST